MTDRIQNAEAAIESLMGSMSDAEKVLDTTSAVLLHLSEIAVQQKATIEAQSEHIGDLQAMLDNTSARLVALESAVLILIEEIEQAEGEALKRDQNDEIALGALCMTERMRAAMRSAPVEGLDDGVDEGVEAFDA